MSHSAESEISDLQAEAAAARKLAASFTDAAAIRDLLAYAHALEAAAASLKATRPARVANL